MTDLLAEKGVVHASECKRLCKLLNLTVNELMVKLLPTAASFAKAKISKFYVGAVVSGKSLSTSDFPNLYFGANLEYFGSSLTASLHAEQSAISNAWLNGEQSISTIATSKMPCGHCRQFLYETVNDEELTVICPDKGLQSETLTSVEINELLPNAFGPKDLDNPTTLMEIIERSERLAISSGNKNDTIFSLAFDAACRSYAPYSSGYSGCAIELEDGSTYVGRTAENAAFNPSLLAFTASLSQLVFDQPIELSLRLLAKKIRRVVLVESGESSSQRRITKSLLSSINETVNLEYHSISFSLNL